MDAFIGLSGMFGFVAFFVVLIINAILKKSKKVPVIGMAVCFVLFFVALNIPAKEKTDYEESAEEEGMSLVEQDAAESSSETADEPEDDDTEIPPEEEDAEAQTYDEAKEELDEAAAHAKESLGELGQDILDTFWEAWNSPRD